MNRQIWILVLSLILVIGGGILEVKYLEKSARYGLSDIEYIQNVIKNDHFDIAKNEIKELEETWNNMKTIWNIFVEHNEIDNIEQTLVEYKVYIENENSEEAIKCGEMLLRSFNHIVEKQEVTIENVF